MCFTELMRGEGATRSKKALAALSGMYGVNRVSRLARWMTALATASDLHASSSSSNYGVAAHSWMLRCTELKKDQSRPSKIRRYRSSSEIITESCPPDDHGDDDGGNYDYDDEDDVEKL